MLLLYQLTNSQMSLKPNLEQPKTCQISTPMLNEKIFGLLQWLHAYDAAIQ